MTLPILKIDPVQGGFTSQRKETSVMTGTGGKPRVRQTVIGATQLFRCQWVCVSNAAYRYFDKFFEITLSEGALPFQVNLRGAEGEDLTPHEALFVPGTYQLNSVAGEVHYVSAELDAFKLNDNQADDEAFLQFYEEYGEEYQTYLNDLERLVNVTALETAS